VKRRYRLTRTTDFKRVRFSGKSYSHPLVVLVASRNGLDVSRFAVTTGRSVGKAVQRNRAKRLIRAVFTAYQKSIDSGWDLIFIARVPITEASYLDVQAAIESLLAKAHLIQKVSYG
jgi:ribonuclease P protein component